MKTDSLIFDLDGTLWDATPTSAKAWNLIFSRRGIDRRITADQIRPLAGLPFNEVLAKLVTGFPADQFEALSDEYKQSADDLYRAEGGQIYEGVREGLESLAGRYQLYIVSNCRKGYIETFLEWAALGHHFKDFESYGNTLQPKSENIRAVVARNRLGTPVYVGDTDGDESATVKAGVPFIHAAYGFGKPKGEWPSVKSFAELVAMFP